MRTVVYVLTLMSFLPLCQAVSADTTVLRNVHLIPMTVDTVIPGQSVVVTNGTISRVGPSDRITIPSGASVVNGTGRYLMPGLADMHTHLNDGMYEYPFFNLFLANGVTTIRDLAQGSPPSVLHYRREVQGGKRLGPNILVARTLWGWENKISELLESQRPLGYDCLKINSYFSPGDFDGVVQLAQKVGWYTLGHIPQRVGLDGALASGMNELSHIEELMIFGCLDIDRSTTENGEDFQSLLLEKFHAAARPMLTATAEQIRAAYADRVKETVRKFRGRDITLTTTMIIHEVIMHKLLDIERIRSAPYARYISPTFWKDVAAGNDKHQKMINPGEERAWFFIYELQNMLLRELKKEDVSLVLGTDVGPTYLPLVPGFSVLDELRLLTENGFTPFDAIATATRKAGEIAERMTGKNDFGTIEVGKRADFILLDRNPFDDIGNVRDPAGVMVSGFWLPRDTLKSLLEGKSTKIADLLKEAYSQSGCEGTLERYRQISNANFRNEYYYSTSVLNALGYELLQSGYVDDAVRVFRLNTEEYPEDWNSFDSYAESLMNAGEVELAIKNYLHALALDPSQENPTTMLRQLQAK